MIILAVDDDRTILETVMEGLQVRGHEVIACTDGEEAWALLEGGLVPDLVILDWVLPGMSGIELCRRIRNRSDVPYVYIVMLTGLRDSSDVIAGIDAGADDYLTKPFHPGEMRARLRAGQRIVELQRKLIQAREELRVQAMQDPLTGILNHGAIVEALTTEADRAHRDERPLSVVMADLDQFKPMNDTWGHVVGDRILVGATLRMRATLRSYDAIGRYGGDEFLIVLPNTGRAQAKRLALRIARKVSTEPFPVEGGTQQLSLSLGVTTWLGVPPLPVERLIQRADEALYVVKGRGGGGVEHLSFEMPDEESSRSGSAARSNPKR